MNDIDVTVYFNEHRLAALDEILNGQGRTIEGVLRKCFEETYASLVPEEKREEIEALIRQKEAKAQREAEKMERLEAKKIPEDIDYNQIKNIASEARQKLQEVRPTSIGQALRISGVNPADISILMVYLKKGEKH